MLGGSGEEREEGASERWTTAVLWVVGGGVVTLLRSFPRSAVRRRSCAASSPTAPAPRGDALVSVFLRQAERLAAAKKASPRSARPAGAGHGAAPEAGGLRPG